MHKLMLNSSTGKVPEKIAGLFDGLANLRGETFFASVVGRPIGKILGRRAQAKAERKVCEVLQSICKLFAPKPVWYRTTDFDADLASRLVGSNASAVLLRSVPRGLGLALLLPELLNFELNLVGTVCANGASNLGVKFPMVSGPSQLKAVRRTLKEKKISLHPGLGIGITIETPAAALQAGRLIREGVRFATVGINDLKALTLGSDRENLFGIEEDCFTNPAILHLLKAAAQAIPKCWDRLYAFGHWHSCGNSDAMRCSIFQRFGHELRGSRICCPSQETDM